MFHPRELIRLAAAASTAIAIVTGTSASPRAQGAVPPIDTRITYILPQWLGLLAADDVPQQIARLRMKIGEGPRVRVGFTTYINPVMAPVDPDDPAAVRAALASTFAQMDEAIARARAGNFPLCLSFVTAVREAVDPLQAAAQAEDRRNMQWHGDNSLAAGWTTFSRYARRQQAIQEAYVREIGRALATRMAANPDILVAASGDGEIEMSTEQQSTTPVGIADYSPFAVAEFRDWLRGRGLYAPGQAFAGEAYALASRYAGDASIATLNADFGQTFATWDLKYFDWSLSDPIAEDPHAMPSASWPAGPFTPIGAIANGFDPPRVHQRGNAWSDLWDLFRQTMVWRHNRDFAKWITTTPDASGATVPADRWFSDQIPADYLFGGTPETPNERLDTSASPLFTADISPYGSLGITSFNVTAFVPGTDVEIVHHRTLAGAAPAIAARRVRWGVFEWNPSVGPTTNIQRYRDEMALVERYRPSVLAPFLWDTPANLPYRFEGTGFETELRALVSRLNNVPLSLSRTSMDIGATTTGEGRTPPQIVRVSGAPGETPAWSITSAPDYLDVVPSANGRAFSVALKPGTYPPGTVPGAIVVTPSEPGYAPATLDVTLRVVLPSMSSPPIGAVDSPADGAIATGELPITGWALHHIGLASVSVYRHAVPGETPVTVIGGAGLVPIGPATFVPGARPDVQGFFSQTPQNDQAGWGYMLLTNFLPDGGNGPFTLSIVAADVDGHSVVIAERRIVARNREATRPFGSIDTPRQGETVAGIVVNFGWTLTPLPKMIAPDGSTIDVLVDGLVVGHPTYGFARADIDTLFTGLANSGAAVGFFVLDTRTMTNGVHTIAWIVRDNTGATQGIGSRFFTVANP